MNKELLEAMSVLEKEYNISKDTLLEAIENSLLTACKKGILDGLQQCILAGGHREFPSYGM